MQPDIEIIKSTIEKYNPKQLIVAVSGGDDSLAALHYTLNQGFKPIIFHINTGTGVDEGTNFVRDIAKKLNLQYIEETNYKQYEEYVIKNGFYGTIDNGEKPHSMAYNVLKHRCFSRVGASFRKSRKNYNILFVSGVRKQESKKRENNAKPISIWNSNIFVSPILEWSKDDELNFLTDRKIDRNPVAMQLCRSGECNCGTPISQATAEIELIELKLNFPKCYQKIIDLQDKVFSAGHKVGWGKKRSRADLNEAYGQIPMFFCDSCTNRNITTHQEYETR